MLFATTLARLIAVRLHLNADEIRHVAVGFLQQVQLYIDHPDYREGVEAKFQEFMEATHRQFGHREIVIASHSLGTVVAFRAILNAASRNQPWLGQVKRFVTFGSPVDLLWLLFPEFFSEVPAYGGAPIHWANYSFGNDPIASDLALVRRWTADKCPGVFAAEAPEEIDLGAGSLTAAHTDYWQSEAMLHEICRINGDRPAAAGTTESAEKPDAKSDAPVKLFAKRRRSGATIFRYAGLGIAALVAWLLLVWWEENLKATDESRLALINPKMQLLLWVAVWAMVVTHVICWSHRKIVKSATAATACLGLACWAVVTLPSLPVFVGYETEGRVTSDFGPWGRSGTISYWRYP